MDRNRPHRPDGTDPPPTDASARTQWAIDDDGNCDHRIRDSLGLGGFYDYERCRACGAVVVTGPTA